MQQWKTSLRVTAFALTLVLTGVAGHAQERQPPPKSPTRPVKRPPTHGVQPGRPPGTSKPPATTRPPGGGVGRPESGHPSPGGRPGAGTKPPGGRPSPGHGGPGGKPPVGKPGGHNRPPGRKPGGHRPPVAHRPPGWGASRPGYSRPPRIWKGRRYYTYHRYYNHPYRPYAWGPAWHPIGFFLNAIAASAVIVAYNDINYRYDAGVYYQPADGGYKVVPPPIGAIVPVLPQDAVSVAVADNTYYYYGGVFYIRINNGYQTVPAPAGAIVYNLPDGCTTVNADGVIYLQYNGDFYQPIEDTNGQPAYEVVEIEDGGN